MTRTIVSSMSRADVQGGVPGGVRSGLCLMLAAALTVASCPMPAAAGADTSALRPRTTATDQQTILLLEQAFTRAGEWRPAGTLEEAEAFAEGSAIPQTLYMAIPERDLADLQANGFERFRNPDGAIHLFGNPFYAEVWARAQYRVREREVGPLSIVPVKVHIRQLWNERRGETNRRLDEEALARGNPELTLVEFLEAEGYEGAWIDVPLDMRHPIVLDPARVMIISEAITTPDDQAREPTIGGWAPEVSKVERPSTDRTGASLAGEDEDPWTPIEHLIESMTDAYGQAVLDEFVGGERYPGVIRDAARTNFTIMYADILLWLYRLAGDLRDRRVAEFGSGPGRIVEVLRRLGGVDAVGIDGYAPFVEFANARDVPLILSTLRTVPDALAGETFDVTFSFDLLDVLSHQYAPFEAMNHTERLEVLQTMAELTADDGWSVHVAERGLPFSDAEFDAAGFDIVEMDDERTIVSLRKRADRAGATLGGAGTVVAETAAIAEQMGSSRHLAGAN